MEIISVHFGPADITEQFKSKFGERNWYALSRDIDFVKTFGDPQRGMPKRVTIVFYVSTVKMTRVYQEKSFMLHEHLHLGYPAYPHEVPHNTTINRITWLQELVKNRKALEIGDKAADFISHQLYENLAKYDCVPREMSVSNMSCGALYLPTVGNEMYQLLLCGHELQRLCNPIKALLEWRRVLTVDGYLILTLPWKFGNEDEYRDHTTLNHLISDFRSNVTESDQTHRAEIKSSIRTAADLSEPAGYAPHVFNFATLIGMAEYVSFVVEDIDMCAPNSIFVVLRKPTP